MSAHSTDSGKLGVGVSNGYGIEGINGCSSGNSKAGATKIQKTVCSNVGRVFDHAIVAVSTAVSCPEATQNKKEGMQRLNERLSFCIARVDQLEEKHKMVIQSLVKLHEKENLKNNFKSSYFMEISNVCQEKSNIHRDRIAKETRLNRLKNDIAGLRARTDEMNHLADTESCRIPHWIATLSESMDEASLLKKRFRDLSFEKENAMNKQNRLLKELADLNDLLDRINIEKLTYQCQASSISDELTIFKRHREEEILELQRLLIVAPADTKMFFNNELPHTICDIRMEYEQLAMAEKTKLENQCMKKIQTIQCVSERRSDRYARYSMLVTSLKTATDELNALCKKMETDNRDMEATIAHLQNEITTEHSAFEESLNERDQMLTRTRDECGSLVAELQTLLDSKALLDGEISIYRAMIDGVSRRRGVKDAQVQRGIKRDGEGEKRPKSITKEHIVIVQDDPAGRFIAVANNSKLVGEHIGGWRLKRTVDNNRELNFYFPTGTVLKPREKIMVFARGQGNPGPNVLVFDKESNWGLGEHVVTAIYDNTGVERSVCAQNTVMESS